MTRENEPGDEVPDNVIAFPKAKTEAPPEAPAADSSASAEPANQGGDDDEPAMTLDAFERAVRAAVQDKLGDEPAANPRGADELVAQVFSALTGKDAKAALAEVRSRLAEPEDGEPGDGEDGSVIDLGAVREARKKESQEAASRVGHAIKDTVSGFIANLAQRQGHTGEITLDAGFFKQHGTALIGNLFQSLASAFMQQARVNLGGNEAGLSGAAAVPPVGTSETPEGAPSAPSAEDELSAAPPAPSPADEATPPTGPSPTQPVQVRLDIGSLLSGLFKRLARPPQPEGEEPPKT